MTRGLSMDFGETVFSFLFGIPVYMEKLGRTLIGN